MDHKTYRALKGSVVKWIRIYKGRGVEAAADNCPLCVLFNRDAEPGVRGCWECPVLEVTGLHFCHETPYIKWKDHNLENHYDSGKAECPGCKKIALEEINFLLSLMPTRFRFIGRYTGISNKISVGSVGEG